LADDAVVSGAAAASVPAGVVVALSLPHAAINTAATATFANTCLKIMVQPFRRHASRRSSLDSIGQGLPQKPDREDPTGELNTRRSPRSEALADRRTWSSTSRCAGHDSPCRLPNFDPRW
jgi:hypothetical protein